MARLDPDERRLLGAVNRGEWREARSAARVKASLKRLAVGHLKKQERINIRLSREDLEGLRKRAVEEGLPYQSLVSSLLHKYVSGRLVERESR